MNDKNNSSVKMSVPVPSLINQTWGEDLRKLPPNEIYALVLDTPFDAEVIYEIETGKRGMGLGKLLGEIGNAYQDAYLNAKETKVHSYLMNALFLREIFIDHQDKLITLNVEVQ